MGGVPYTTAKMHNKLFVGVASRQRPPCAADISRVAESFYAWRASRLAPLPRGLEPGRHRRTVAKEKLLKKWVGSQSLEKERMRKAALELTAPISDWNPFVVTEDEIKKSCVKRSSRFQKKDDGDDDDDAEDPKELERDDVEVEERVEDGPDTEEEAEAKKEQKQTMKNAFLLKKRNFVRKKPASSRWIPSLEEKKVLFSDNSFVVKFADSRCDPIDITLWRIIEIEGVESEVMLEEFAPVDLNNRVVHVHLPGTSKEIQMRRCAIYRIYRPVIALTLTDSSEVGVVLYIVIPNIVNYIHRIKTMGIQKNEALLSDMQNVIRLIARSLWTKSITERFTQEDLCENAVCREGWDRIHGMVSSRVLKFKHTDQENSKIVRNIQLCRFIKFKRLPRSIGSRNSIKCESCTALGLGKKPAYYKAVGIAKPYNDLTFEDVETHVLYGTEQVARVCYTCGEMFKALSILLHFKWYLYASIRAQVTNWVGELEEDEFLDWKEVTDLLTNNLEWCNQVVFEFLVAAYAVDKEISKLKARRPQTSY